MSEYNLGALDAWQEKLKLNVKMKPHLSDLLEEKEGGFMTRVEAKTVLLYDTN